MITALSNKALTDKRSTSNLTSDDGDALCADARLLVQRGAPFNTLEATLLGQAWPYVQTRPVEDGLGVLVAQITAAFAPKASVSSFFPTSSPPFDEKIAEVEQELAAATSKLEAAQAALQDAQRARERRGRRDMRPNAELSAVVTHAREAYFAAEQAWLRVKTRLQALQLTADRWRYEQA